MSLIFWVIIIVWLLFGIWVSRTNRDYVFLGNGFIVWLLFVLLGYAVFGFKF